MRIVYYERITNTNQLSDILNLLTLCDKEFIPPLSHRDSTIQNNLKNNKKHEVIPTQYFSHIKDQSAFVIEDNKHVVGFMSFKKNYICEEITASSFPNIYITTIIVHPDYRNKGITNSFYEKMISEFKDHNVFTRTWSTNDSHIHILLSLKFYEYCRKKDDRGYGIDTVYYHHASTASNK